jgi:Lipocalin-like domain
MAHGSCFWQSHVLCTFNLQNPKKQAMSPIEKDLSEHGIWSHIDSPESEGKPSDNLQPKGMLIYTRDGHMSVQLMYPKSPTSQSNQYVLDGYEASFGSYDVDEVKHVLTHHVQGSITRDSLVGKDLPRVYQFTADRKLIIRSARPDEHWSVTWEHY